MPVFGRSARFFTILALMVLIPGLAQATTKKHTFEIGIQESFTRFDSQYGSSSEWYQSIEVGFNFTQKHGIEFGYASFTASPEEGSDFPTTMNISRLGYVYNRPFHDSSAGSKLVALFRFGVGQQNIDPAPHVGGPSSLEDPDRSFMWYGGGGFRYFFNEWLGLRLDGTIDFVYTEGGLTVADVQGTGNIGLIFAIGGKDSQ